MTDSAESQGGIDIERIINKLIPSPETSEEEDNLTGDKQDRNSLYQLLDELSGTRKLMNTLFSPSRDVNLSSNNDLNKKLLELGKKWYLEEKKSTNKPITSTTLGNDTPVYFSWSHEVKTTSTSSSPTEQPMKNSISDSHEDTNNNIKEDVTNEKLFDLAQFELQNMKNCSLSWRSILNDESNHPEVSSTSTDNTSHHTKIDPDSMRSKSSFKVNPLATFVAQELPKERKSNQETHEKKNKKKGKLWFWGSNKSKMKHNKSDHSVSESKSENTSTETDDHLQDFQSYTNISKPEGNIEETYDPDSIMNNIMEDDPFKTDDENIMKSLDDSTANLEPTDAVDENDWDIDEEVNEINLIDKQKSHVKDKDTDKDEDEDDEDFGDFEQASPSPISTRKQDILGSKLPPSIPTVRSKETAIKNSLTSAQPSLDNTNASEPNNLTMSSFLPLQPTKK